MTKKEQLRALNALLHIKAVWRPEYQEWRVTIGSLSVSRQEDVAYYTHDYEDAYGTAVAMSARHTELSEYEA